MKTKRNLFSVSAFGLYSHGLVSLITNKIYSLQGNIVDVEESSRRGLFSMFLVVDFSASEQTDDQISTALKDLQNEVDIRMVIRRYKVKDPVLPAQHENHLVTIIGVDQPGIIAKISSLLHTYRITIEKTRMIARGRFFSMEMLIDTSTMITSPERTHAEQIKQVKSDLRKLCAEIDQSVVIQSGEIYQRQKKLVVFDVESSLVQQASLNKFIKAVSSRLQPGQQAEASPQKQDDPMKVLVENAKRLKGQTVDTFRQYAEILQLNPGTIELIKILKSMGFKIALLSSGYNFFTKKIFEAAGVDYAFSNTLEMDEAGVFTGNLEQPIITSETKEELLEFIIQNENIKKEQVIAVGDGSKSSHFIKNVGLSIALQPENPMITTDGVLGNDQLLNLLNCLGIGEEDLNSYLDD